MKGSQCNVNNNYNTFQTGANCNKIASILSDVKQQLVELKEEIKEIKENRTGSRLEKVCNKKLFQS